ncbi:MAG: hypothetical protein C4K58_03380 [Flavobacteriaceae bacterium]|nr:MAG: hypothetical protein C4K58_03380 [Flavobacteriaceae bacterium]
MPKYTNQDSKFVLVDGINVHYRKTGSGEKTILLLHGVASSLHTFEDWQKGLSKNYTVISIDLPGFGLTGPFTDNKYNPVKYNKFLDGLLSKLGVEKVILAGNSFGGFLAWNYAVHAPERVSHLILYDAAGIKREIPNLVENIAIGTVAGGSRIMIPRPIVGMAVKLVYQDTSKVSSDLITRYWALLNLPPNKDMNNGPKRKSNKEGFSNVMKMNHSFNNMDFTQNIASISVPTLILWGENDKALPVKNAYEFQKLIKNSKLHVFQGVGHVPMEEIPEESSRVLEEFIMN